MSNSNDPAPADGRPATWETWRTRIYRGYAVAVGVANPAAFLESFRGLLDWCNRNGLHGFYGWIGPMMVDVFTVGGEGVLLLAAMDGWPRRRRAAGWAAAVGGMAVSTAGNVGRDGWHAQIETMVTYAVAPLALAALSALGLMIIKQVLHPGAPGAAGGDEGAIPGDALVALARFGDYVRSGTLPTHRDVRGALRCGHDRADRIREYIRDLHAAAAGAGDPAAQRAGVS